MQIITVKHAITAITYIWDHVSGVVLVIAILAYLKSTAISVFQDITLMLGIAMIAHQDARVALVTTFVHHANPAILKETTNAKDRRQQA